MRRLDGQLLRAGVDLWALPSHRFLSVVESLVLDGAKDSDEVEVWRAELYDPPSGYVPARQTRRGRSRRSSGGPGRPRRRPMTADQARRVAANLESWSKEVGDE